MVTTCGVGVGGFENWIVYALAWISHESAAPGISILYASLTLRRMAGALQDGQARIFCKRRISYRALAQTKYRTALGLNFSCMGAVGAQTGKRLPKLRSMVACPFHTFRILPQAFKSGENESLQEHRQRDLVRFCVAGESAITFFKIDMAQPASAAVSRLMSGAPSRDFTRSMTDSAFCDGHLANSALPRNLSATSS